MTPTTLEREVSSTAQSSSGYDDWVCTTGGSDSPHYAHLSRFDLAVISELNRIAALKPNWDAEDARPISTEIVMAARKLVSRLPNDLKETVGIPAVVPMARGSERSGNLQFEWDDGTRSLELEVENPTMVHFLQWHPEQGIEREDFFSIDHVESAVSLIRWFTGS